MQPQPPDPDISRQSTTILHSRLHSSRLRRFLGLGGIVFSLGMILSLVAYTYSLHPEPLQKLSHHVSTIFSTPTPTITCSTSPHNPGTSKVSITSGGLKRTLLIHLASSYGIQPQALVINYHGYNFTAEHMASYSQMTSEADKAGFVLVFPQGVDNPPSWNAGINGQGIPTGTADDVQFTRDMLSFLEKNYCVDSHRVYVTGFSLGGGMAYRVACTLTNQIAAIATVAGAFYHAPGGCQPSRPIPVLEIHGQADEFAPYNGNPIMGMAAVQAYLNIWLNHDHCTGSSQTIFHKADVAGIAWQHCTNGTVVEHYRISDGGHTWPGGGNISSLGYSTHTINANVLIWNFFSQYSN